MKHNHNHADCPHCAKKLSVKKENKNFFKEKQFDIIRLILSACMLVLALILNAKDYIKTILFLTSYIVAALPVLINAIKNILKGEIFDENFLMSVASIGAIIIGEYSEAVAVMIFYETGEMFQDYAVNKSRKSITRLMDLKSDFARIITGGEEKEIPPEDVSVGSIISVKAGEKVPLDGVIEKGITSFDVSSLTGEAVPYAAEFGDSVLAGSININGAVLIKVTKEYKDSSVAKILNLIENSSSKKSSQESFITRFAKKYTPAVCISALLIAFVPLILGLDFEKWVYRALIFLVVSCPCALVISVPLSFFSGIGIAAKYGILIKGGNSIENLAKTNTLVFDKTGTLTDGAFRVSKVISENGFEDVMEYASAAERISNHPISKAISVYPTAYTAEEGQEIAGFGVIATVNNRKVICGNEKFFIKHDISVNSQESGAKVYVAIDGIYSGCIVLEDNIRDSVKEMLEKINGLGIKNTVMLTGDNILNAKHTAEKLEINEVYGELLPSDKVDKIKELQSAKNKVAFVGDGINDAPVLTMADVGISMGGIGSDAAIEASDIVIMNDNLEKIPTAIKISKRTVSIVKQNIIIALGIKFLIMILSILGFATMWEAVFADVGVMILAVLNSLRNFIKIK